MNQQDRSADSEPTHVCKLLITPRAMLEVRQPGNPQIHPDGHRVAFELDEADFEASRYVTHIWLTEWIEPDVTNDATVCVTDEAPAELPTPEQLTRQLTYSAEGEWDPQWSPDGAYLAFLSDRIDPSVVEDTEEEPTTQVWILPMEGGEARKITSAKEGVLLYRWSPEADSIVFVAPEPRPQSREAYIKDEADRRKVDAMVEPEVRLRRRIWRTGIEQDGPSPELIWHGDCGIQDISISPDGSRICFATNRSGDPDDYHICELWIVDGLNKTECDQAAPEKRNAYLLTDRNGDKSKIRWSPDSNALLFLSWLDPALSFSNQCAFWVAVSDSREKQDPTLIDPLLDTDVVDIDWSLPTGTVWAIAAVGTSDRLLRLQRLDYDGSNRFEAVSTDCSACMRWLALDPEGESLAWVQESSSALPEVVLKTPTGVVHVLTRLNAEFSDTYLLPKQEVVSWQAKDGVCIEGVLTYPAVTAEEAEIVPAPCVLHLHGGPKGRAVNSLQGYLMASVWSAAGYVVLAPNYRGSEGYGAEFAVASRRDLGGRDYEDVISGLDHVIAAGLVDPKRLGIMGGSYGGFLTNCAITRTDRFAAAISMFGILNLKTDFSMSTYSRWNYEYLGGYYWDDPEIYQRLSPDSHVDRITTPTLILHGDEDENTFIGNSRELYNALRKRGTPTQFVHYPRESHGLSEPNHRLDEMRRALGWMDRYLKQQTFHRVGDVVSSFSGEYELTIVSADWLRSPGYRPDPPNTGMVAVSLILHRKSEMSGDAVSLPVSVGDIQLELRPASATEARGGASGSRSPAGILIESMGVKNVLSGSDMRFTLTPAPQTGEINLSVTLVFAVESSGRGMFCLNGFPAVEVDWSQDSGEDSGEVV